MDIGKNLQQSIDLYFKNFGTLLLACLIGGLISTVSFGILAGPLVGGFLVLGLKLLRGEKGEFTEIFAHFDQLLPTLIATFLLWGAGLVGWIIGMIPVIGWIFNFIAGPALGLLYFLTIGFIVDQKMQPLEAVKRSIDSLAAEPVLLWVYSLLFMIIGGLGAVLLFVGVILTMPLGMTGMVVAYQQIAKEETPLFKPEKRVLQITGISLAVLVVAGVVCLLIGIGRHSSRSQGTGLTAKILSGIVGKEVELNQKGKEIKNITIGSLNFRSGLPENFPKDIPIFPQAEIGGFLGSKGNKLSGSTTTLTSKATATEIFEYYTANLEDKGWTIRTSELGDMKMINFQKSERSGSITINPRDSGCDILIGITTE